MKKTLPSVSLGLIVLAGCGGSTPPPARVDVPERATVAEAPRYNKPMPAPSRDDLPPPPFDDVPLVNQQAPETPAYVQAYNAVGRPRIVVFVNRTLQGETIPVNPNDPLVSVEHRQSSNAPVTVEHTDNRNSDSYYEHRDQQIGDKFESKGPAEYKESTAIYLRPGQYDEVAAKSLDYDAVENILMDFLGGDGQVTLISPTLVRQKLTDQQIKDLESGRPQVASEIVQQLGADILIQVAAHPTRQSSQGLQVRLVCEAMNIKGGQSLARAVVDVPPPLEKTQINKFTRFCARKMMHDMTATWGAPPPVPTSAAPAAPAEKPMPPVEPTTPVTKPAQ